MSPMAEIELNNDELTSAICMPSTSFYSDYLNISREIEGTQQQYCGAISICNTENSLSISCNKELSPVGNSLSERIQDGSMRMPKECMVCGYATKHRHYGVSSCNACKTFFRRSILLYKQYKCKFKGMCAQTKGVQLCRACRFDRCVLAGMNPRTMHLPDSANVREISEQVENRQHYLHQKFTEEYPVVIRQKAPVFEESIEDKLIKSLIYVELKVNRIRESSHRPHESTLFLNIREIIEHNKNNILAQADHYTKEQSWPLMRQSDVLELMQSEAKAGDPHFLMFDIFLSIETAKTFPVFSQLDFKDQELLIKEVAFANTKLTEAFYSYQMKSDTVMMPNGVMPMKLAYPGLDDTQTRIKHVIFSQIMEPFFRTDISLEEFVLLKAIIYSYSAIPEMSQYGKTLLKSESRRYSKALMKHLQSRMGAVPGARKYAQIISLTDCIFSAAQRHREFHAYTSSVVRPHHCGRTHQCPPYMHALMYS